MGRTVFKSILKNILKVLPFVAFAYVIYRIASMDVDWKQILNSSSVLLALLFILVFYFFSVLFTAFNYVYALSKISGARVPFKKIVSVYLESNLFKYLPGNVLHYVGRNTLGAGYNIPHKDIAFTSLFEAAGNVFFITLISSILGFSYIIRLVNLLREKSILWFFILISAIVLGITLFILGFLFSSRFRSLIKRLFKKETISIWFISALVFLLNYIINGFSFFLILSALYEPLKGNDLFLILIAYNIAWLAGFITPGAPGGIGIKEFVLLFILGTVVSEEPLMLSILLHRFGLIMADLLAYFGRKIFL